MQPIAEAEYWYQHGAISQLIIEASHLVDQRDFTAFAALFTADGALYRPTTPEPLVGPAAIALSYSATPATRINRHLISNLRIACQSATEATSSAYVTLYSSDAAESADPILGATVQRCLIGAFHDRLVWQEGSWWLQERRAAFALNASPQGQQR